MEFTTVFLIIMWLGIRLGLGLFFKKANESAWKAFIPVYSSLIWLKLIKKPKWWLLLTFVPVVNIVLGIGMIVDLLNSFNRRNVVEHVLGSVVGFIYLPYLGLTQDLEYVGPVDYKDQDKPKIREWSEAIFFAVIAATIIRTFTIEAFQIPTASMESTLLRGDFLFVSKVHYGAKTPQTPLALPFMHHSMPILNVPAYLDWIELPYFRFPPLQDIKRNDIVVFNYPQEDYRPIDKREHYIKRCVAIPGDSMVMDGGLLYINSQQIPLAATGQMSYNFNVSNSLSLERWVHEMDLNEEDCGCQKDAASILPYNCIIYGTAAVYEELKKQKWITSPIITGLTDPSKPYYPGGNNVYPSTFGSGGDVSKHWSRDFYGPVWMPIEGQTIALTEKNYTVYKRAFDYYENTKVVSVKHLLNAYMSLEQLKKYKVPSASWQEYVNLASKVKKLHSFVMVSDKLSQWADYFFMQPYIINHLGSSQIQAKKDFSATLTQYQKNERAQEVDSILSLIQNYAPHWIENGKINVQRAFVELDSTNAYPCYVNGKISSEYTFKQDYYFMVGDNRHNSGDSRAWGFVPYNHIVGKAVFVWLSTDPDADGFIDGIRWDRLCSFVSADGLSRSYFYEFLIGGVLLYFGNKYLKKRKKVATEKDTPTE